MKPSFSDFKDLAKRGNLIPVYQDIPSRGLDPVSVYQKIRPPAFSYLLESAEDGKKFSRYSFIGYRPFLKVVFCDDTVEVIREEDGKRVETVQDPLTVLKELLKGYRPIRDEHLPAFQGGLVGYVNYDLVRKWEHLPGIAPRDNGVPESVFTANRQMIIFDHMTSKIVVLFLATPDKGRSLEAVYEEARKGVEECIRDLDGSMEEDASSPRCSASMPESNFSKAAFKAAVLKAKEHIVGGDIIQVVLSQRFSGKCQGNPLAVYCHLRELNPSPYMFYLNFDENIMLGSSPEVLVRLIDGRIELRPIAGTRPRGKDPGEDRHLEEELLADPKELAEHLMLVDLGRNDVGKVASTGSVRVSPFIQVERYSHVMHIVSGVEGRLDREKDCFDLFRSAFPAGTLSGAPKIEAMKIISELEPSSRGFYGGAVGHFGFDGSMDFCIAIRSMTLHGTEFTVQAGAGIVFDSSPEKEYEECLNKAAALFKAIERAGNDSLNR